MKIFDWLGFSFNTNPQGPSARKLSAFACICSSALSTCGIGYICFLTSNPAYLFYAFCVWMMCGLIYLGMVTIPQLLLALKTVKGENTTETKTEIKSTTETHESV